MVPYTQEVRPRFEPTDFGLELFFRTVMGLFRCGVGAARTETRGLQCLRTDWRSGGEPKKRLELRWFMLESKWSRWLRRPGKQLLKVWQDMMEGGLGAAADGGKAGSAQGRALGFVLMIKIPVFWALGTQVMVLTKIGSKTFQKSGLQGELLRKCLLLSSFLFYWVLALCWNLLGFLMHIISFSAHNNPMS